MPNEKFPNGGAMSQYVNGLNVGNKINVLGPRGKIIYKGLGKLTNSEQISFHFGCPRPLNSFSHPLAFRRIQFPFLEDFDLNMAGYDGKTPLHVAAS